MKVLTYRGIRDGWILRSERPPAEAERLAHWLRRIDPDFIHKARD